MINDTHIHGSQVMVQLGGPSAMYLGSCGEANMSLDARQDGNLSVIICLIPNLVTKSGGELVRVLVGMIGLRLSALFLYVIPCLAQLLELLFAHFSSFLEELGV